MPNSVNREIPERVAVRAVTRYRVLDGCWISTYSVASHGYAQIGWRESGSVYMTLAHRAAWVSRFGQIPSGMTIDHTCRTLTCVNPAHLRVLPNLENARRTFGRDWPLGFCAQGHSEDHWRPKGPERNRGYCAKCKDLAEGRVTGT